jgi:flagellar biosynthesis protein FlhG
VSAPGDSKPRVVAIASGRGGTGKSLLAANIGVFLATLGKRVVLVDAALGSATLHIFVGVTQPEHTLGDVLGKGGPSLAEAVESTPVPGLHIVAGEGDPLWVGNPRSAQINRLRNQLRKVDADYVIVDLGPGTSTGVLDLLLDADTSVLVAVPEPTSIELCYRVLRAAFARRMRGDDPGARAVAEALRASRRGVPAPLDIYLRAAESDPGAAESIRQGILGLSPQLVINCARSKSDMEIGRAVAAAARRRMGLPVQYLGHLEYDEAVWVSIRRRAPLLVEHPESRVAKCIEKIARRLQASRDSGPHVTDIFAGDTHYDYLEVPPTASFEDIRRANRRVREIYGPDSPVMSGLYERIELEVLHRHFDDAYDVLMDAAKRKAYDQKLFPEGIPAAQAEVAKTVPAVAERVEVPPADRPPMPDLDGDTEFTGAVLKQVREAQGIDLREIAERTKIGIGYLQALEDEIFKKLPATVYVRGFLVEYAKSLGIPVDRVLETYLERYRKARRKATEGVAP